MKRGRFFAKGLLLVITALIMLPAPALSGSLGPAAAPAPTMHTLEDIYKKLDAIYKKIGARFEVTQTDAVIDRETGLVWQRNTDSATRTWDDAVTYCSNLNIINLINWRLPTRSELVTLVDRLQATPALPNAHPFTNPQFFYWTSTVDGATPNEPFYVDFMGGTEGNINKAIDIYVRCVRSGL
ncbi:MAG: DUF1566 domain-containing protein [Deltaproteobacteria bacterium]|nr:DUF1566 domain-containing protein [Deltaproteobacteria bacterium]